MPAPILNAANHRRGRLLSCLGVRRAGERSEWDRYPSRVVSIHISCYASRPTRPEKARLFVLDGSHSRFPKLVRTIATAGHEIGCHSFWHRLIFQMSPDEFRAIFGKPARQSRKAARCAGDGYCAENFLITRGVTLGAGYSRRRRVRNDSSIHPIWRPLRIPGRRADPTGLSRASGNFRPPCAWRGSTCRYRAAAISGCIRYTGPALA